MKITEITISMNRQNPFVHISLTASVESNDDIRNVEDALSKECLDFLERHTPLTPAPPNGGQEAEQTRATQSQLKYIDDLVSSADDEKVVDEFLRKVKKAVVFDLSRSEASQLIETLKSKAKVR